MKKNIIQDKSFSFSIRIINCYKFISSNHKSIVPLSNQLLRSGTAIGALIKEAEMAESKKDFIHKLHIALKEANETEYWIELLIATKYLEISIGNSIKEDVIELKKLLISIIKTTKNNLNKIS